MKKALFNIVLLISLMALSSKAWAFGHHHHGGSNDGSNNDQGQGGTFVPNVFSLTDPGPGDNGNNNNNNNDSGNNQGPNNDPFIGNQQDPVTTNTPTDVPSTPVPEPMTLALLGGGLAGIAIKKYRHRN